ncbi:site-2 protease family protein [bacterium]|nr:site-2 protease family protein [bacterium]MBP9810541.1 site-2 protease family protein [bacterium]
MNKLVMYEGKRPPTSMLIVAAVVLASIVSVRIFGMVATLLILSAWITLHEFGHWIVARISGIEVPVFSVGLGSANQAKVMGRAFGTEFQLRPFPVGGFIKPDEKSFASASFTARAATLAAGPMMNLLIPVVLFFLLFAIKGVPDIAVKDVYLTDLSSSVSTAATAGLEKGDIFLAVAGVAIEKPEQIVRIMEEHKLQTVTLLVSHLGQTKTVTLVPNSEGKIGIAIGVHTEQVFKEVSTGTAAIEAFSQTASLTEQTLAMYGQLFQGENLDHVSSVVGIVSEGGKQVNGGLVASISFAAMLSIALAVLNLVPLPILDGGQLVLLALERYRGRPLSDAVRGYLIAATVVFFIGLFFLALYNDLLVMVGNFWAVPVVVVALCALFYYLLPFLGKLRASKS